MKTGVVVTGLPASGKTTVARELATRLGFAFFDKDDFLEELYERNDVTSWEHRKALSRQSDGHFKDAAIRSGSAVLVSHWRPLGADGESGTPTDWLSREYEALVEVCCLCSAEEAFKRFLGRTRHPGHFDRKRDLKELAQRMGSLSRCYPLGIGSLVEVRTDGAVDMDFTTMNVSEALARL